MPHDAPSGESSPRHLERDPAAAARFRATLARVLLIQAITLALLALLQIRYGA